MQKIIVIFFLLFSLQLFAQYKPFSKYYDDYTTSSLYFSFNSNPLLAQAVPLNGISPAKSHPSIMIRSYNDFNRGFRFGYALGLNERNDLKSMFFTADYDNRRRITQRWIYFQGFGATLRLDSDRFDRFSTTSLTDEKTFSLAWHSGFEYIINNVFSLSVEAALRAGTNLTIRESFINIDPPVNIIAHFSLNNEN